MTTFRYKVNAFVPYGHTNLKTIVQTRYGNNMNVGHIIADISVRQGQ